MHLKGWDGIIIEGGAPLTQGCLLAGMAPCGNAETPTSVLRISLALSDIQEKAILYYSINPNVGSEGTSE